MKIADVKIGMVVQNIYEQDAFDGVAVAYEVMYAYSNGLVALRKLDGVNRRKFHSEYARTLEPVPPLDGLLELALAELKYVPKPFRYDPDEDDPF